MKYPIIKPSDQMARCLGIAPEDVPEAVVTSGSLFLYDNWDDIISSSEDEEVKQQYCTVRTSLSHVSIVLVLCSYSLEMQLLYSLSNKYIGRCRTFIAANLNGKRANSATLKYLFR
jgi:hypothetical protein